MPTAEDQALQLKQDIRSLGAELGFAAIGFASVDLSSAEAGLTAWLAEGYHGEMSYMARHGALRARPAELLPGSLTVITARMNYWPQARAAQEVLADPELGYVSRYALGRDYHKVLRKRLQMLAEGVALHLLQPLPHRFSHSFSHRFSHQFRVFVDSAPLLEVELATRSGLGWRGKHTLNLERSAGSWFFLGEILTDLALPPDPPLSAHCGRCRACLDVCPTGAILAPYRLDARRCISYLTIELAGPIPEDLRPAIGNRIYGCDDCQLFCPWNRGVTTTQEPDFAPRHGLDGARLVELFAWTAQEFSARMAGSPIHRIGYERWLRNLAVALGNVPMGSEVPANPELRSALAARRNHDSALVREHVAWALQRQGL